MRRQEEGLCSHSGMALSFDCHPCIAEKLFRHRHRGKFVVAHIDDDAIIEFARANPSKPLVVDVGANNGDDSDYYLRKGFRVLAIEADPELAKFLRRRFERQMEESLYHVANVAVTDSDRVITFYRNTRSEWSSTRKNTKATKTNSHQVMEVAGTTLGKLLQPFDKIHYVKTDIEGAELEAVRSLSSVAARVEYFSFELNPDWQAILELLAGYGYERFKLIRQGRDHLQPPPQPAREGEYVDVQFTGNMSGTFGRELPGEWMTMAAIVEAILACNNAMRARTANGQPSGWYDIHAAK